MAEETEGLRARKKRAARRHIADAARRLFAERGYDAVTVAEVAAAADVSEKTVFNHFGTKEDLVLPDREDDHRRLLAELEERPAVDVFRDASRAAIAALDDVLVQIVSGSPALQRRLADGWRAPAGDDLGAALVTTALAAVHHEIVRLALTGAPRARLQRAADAAYRRFA